MIWAPRWEPAPSPSSQGPLGSGPGRGLPYPLTLSVPQSTVPIWEPVPAQPQEAVSSLWFLPKAPPAAWPALWLAWGPPPAAPVPGVEIGRVGGRRRRPRTHGSCPDKPTTTVSRSRSRIKRHKAWSVPTCPQEAVITPDEAVLVWPLPQSSPVHRPQVALPRAGCGTPGCPHAPCARLSPSSWTSLPRPAPDSFNCSAPWLKSPGNSRSWRPSARLGATLEGGGPREAGRAGGEEPT